MKDRHTPEDVVKVWLLYNDEMREKKSDWAIYKIFCDLGDQWKKAAKDHLDYEKDLTPKESAQATQVCPYCDEEITNNLKSHLPCEGSKRARQTD